jgi:hypothetical protein
MTERGGAVGTSFWMSAGKKPTNEEILTAINEGSKFPK